MTDHAQADRQALIADCHPLKIARDAAVQYLGERWALHRANRVQRLRKPLADRLDGSRVLRKAVRA